MFSDGMPTAICLARVADSGAVHEAADPGDRGAEQQRREADREVAGQPRRRTTKPMMISASTGSAIHAASHICAAGRIEMNVIEMPASVPSSAARGVNLRMYGPTNAPDEDDHADDERPCEAGLPGLDRVLRRDVGRQHDRRTSR